MATATTPFSLLHLPPPLAPFTRPNNLSIKPARKLPTTSLQSNNNLRCKFTTLPQECRRERLSPVRAVTGEITPSQVPLDKVQQIVPAASDDGIVSKIVAVLLGIAFVGLCVLTLGVIYLGVEDFLTKRNREKFEKEEEEKKKKEKKSGGKKRVIRGPKSVMLGIGEDDD